MDCTTGEDQKIDFNSLMDVVKSNENLTEKQFNKLYDYFENDYFHKTR